MRHEWLLAGFGGQGILFLGDLLAQAAMRQGLHTTYMPTYGVAMRGGTANCVVRLSNKSIGSPMLETPDAAIILNQQSFNKFVPGMQTDGLVIANASMVENPGPDKAGDRTVVWIPATEIARDAAGTEQATNMVALGAFLGSDATIQVDTIEKIMAEERNPAKQKLVQTNMKAIRAGLDFVKNLSPS